MQRFWDEIVKPIFDAVNPKVIVEIGTDYGKNTLKLLDYCQANGSVLHVVDPLPKYDVDEWRAKYRNRIVFHLDLSLKALPNIPDSDVVFVDGDHNWYTVTNELKILKKHASNGTRFPVVFFHDVGWPYARRDLYYNPENIPADFRQPYQKLGMHPSTGDLLPRGGFNDVLCNAVYENTLRNGVLTAIEDFLNESNMDIHFTRLDGFFGLGVLVPSERMQESPNLKNIIDGLQPSQAVSGLMAAVERSRVLERINYESTRMKLKQQEEQFKNQMDQLTKGFEEKHVKLEKRIEELSRLDAQVKKLNEQMKQRIQERDQLRKVLEDTRSSLRQANRDRERLRLSLKRSEQSIQDLRKVRDGLIQDLDHYRAKTLRQAAPAKAPAKKASNYERDYRILQETPYFDPAFYLRRYPDLSSLNVDPIDHYLKHGLSGRYDPSPVFSSSFYLRRYPDVADAGLNPLVHFVLFGKKENRIPNPNKVTPNFNNFEEYLRYALVDFDAIKSPLMDPDRRILGIMDSYKQHLAKKYRDRPQNDLVSIIMPSYNRAHIIDFAIKSVLDQSYENWELIISDDCSQDDTESVVAKHGDSRIRYMRLEENRGASGARKEAVEASKGQYITYLDTDDTWDKDFILISVNILKDSPGFHSIYSAQKMWFPPPDIQDDQEYVHNDEENLRLVRFASFNRSFLENTNYVSMIAFMHDREVLEKYGPFRTNRLEDWDLALRYSTDSPIYSLPVALSHYQLGRDELQRSKTLSQVRAHALEQIDLAIQTRDLSSQLKEFPAVRDFKLFGLVAEPRQTGYERKVSIIIPSFEVPEFLEICIAAVRKWTDPGRYEIIVVDNASKKAVVKYLKAQERKHQDIQVVYNNSNLGFTFATNQGIQLAQKENDIVLMNNDAMVTPGWLPGLQEVVEVVNDAALVTPRQALLADTKTLKTHVPGCNPQREMDTSLSAHHKNVLDPHFDRLRGFVELSFAPFFCVYITRETLNEVGLLDVENGPHYGSDKLYCDAIRNYGQKRIIYTPHSKVYHFHQRATAALKKKSDSEYIDMFVRNDWNAIKKSSDRSG